MPSVDAAAVTALVLFEVLKIIVEVYLIESMKGLQDSIWRSLPTFFMPWYVFSTAMRLYFFAIITALTQIDDDISAETVFAQTVVRWIGLLVFYAGAIMFPFSMLSRVSGAISKCTAMVPIISTLAGYGILIFAHITQVLIPGGMDSSCDCWTTTLSITSFCAGIIALPLFLFDVVWGESFYSEENQGKYFTVRGQTQMGEVVELTGA